MAWHGVLGPCLGNFNEVEEAALTLFETSHDRFIWKLWEVLVLHDEVMKIIAQVVGTGCSTMAIEDSEETDLRPFNVQVCFTLWLEDVENDRDSVLIVLSDDALVRVGRVRLDQATLLLRGLRGLVVLKEQRLWVQNGRVFSEEERLDFHELDV